MKRNSLWSLIVAIFLISACASSKTASVDATYVAKSGFILAKPVVVDIDVQKRKITGSAIIKNKLYGAELAQDAAKKLAVLDAIKKGDADVIIQPSYEIETKNNITTASVSGYAGKYKEFRDLAMTDTLAFNLRADMDQSSLVVNMDGPGEVRVEKKKSPLLLLGIVAGIVALSLIISQVVAD